MSGTRIPPRFPLDLPGREHSKGERLFYDAFGRDERCRNMTLIHSVFISKHIKNISGEIDLVLLVPGKGIFLLEVKHGGLSKKDGIWYTHGKKGVSPLRVSPFRQLQDTARSLEIWLRDRLQDPAIIKKYGEETARSLALMRIGNGYVFSSELDWTHQDTEHEPWMICTKPMIDAPHGISSYVARLAHNYEAIPAWQRASIPDQRACNCLRDILAGDLEVHYDVLQRFADEERALQRLTREQLEVLANTRYNQRCLFTGGAGTGKTVLALELFLEKTLAGQRVALICYNKNLADRLRQQLHDVQGVDPERDIRTLHAFMLDHTGLMVPPEDQDQFFRQELVDAFLDKGTDPMFDHIIVDEAQDLLAVEYLWILNALVKGGLAQGSWTMFGDLSHQLLFKDEQQVREAIDLLGQSASYYRAPPLRINCRNTRNIGMSLPDHTGCGEFRFPEGSPDGAPLAQRFPATTNKRNEEIRTILRSLEKLPGTSITILSPRRDVLDEIAAIPEVLAKGCRLETIHSFKGLESPVVILTGFRSLLQKEDIQLLYVGMSRARHRLYLLLDLGLQDEYKQLLKRFITLSA